MDLQVAAVDPVVVRDHQPGELDVLVLDRLQRAIERPIDEIEATEARCLELRQFLLVMDHVRFRACSAHLPGDVVLGALVGWIGEDLLGLVVLDDSPRRCFSVESSSTIRNAVRSETLAACCMLWVTMTIENPA